MKKRVLSLLLCLGMIGALTVGCSNQVNQGNSTKTETETKEETKKISEMSEKELEEAWKKEPAYGKTIKVGYNGGGCLGGFGIALAKGFYEAEGIDAEIVSMTSTTDALGTGKVDIAGDHIATLLVPVVNGVNMTFTTASQTGCKSLYVLADSGIETTKDLVGKTIAIPDGVGQSDQNITMRYLTKDGIDPNDVNYKVTTTDAVVQAMKSGEVQAANLSDQFARPFVKDGTLKYIRSITYDDDFSKEPCCIMGINSDFMEKNPITSYKLTKAFSDANDWIEDNKAEAAQILIDNSWASGDVETVQSFLEEWNFKISDEDCGTALKNVLKDYKEFGLFDEDIDVDKTLDTVWKPLLLNE